MEEKLSVVNKTKCKIPVLPVSRIKEEILGKDYALSLAYITPKTSRAINKACRGKDRPTNVLSFPLDKKSGEMLICPSLVRKETGKFDKNYKDLLLYMFIHGTLHLKGFKHGKKMEKTEEKYLSRTKFLIK